MAILAFLFAVLLPQLRLILNSWDSKAGRSDALQNGCVLLDHLTRNLQSARRITAVPDMGETFGFIEFEDNDANSFRYDAHEGTPRYVKFGTPGNLYDLAGPVSRFQVYCYSLLDVDNPLGPITDPNLIRCVEVEVTLTNPAAMGGDLTLSTAVMLRNDSVIEADANDPNLLFVVGNMASLTTDETDRKTLIESWGYTVTLISAADSQTNFDTATASNDVAYVSQEASASLLGAKLNNTTIGVVNENKDMIDDFGFATGASMGGGLPTLKVDFSHYITSVFTMNPVSPYAANDWYQIVNEPVATGVQPVGLWVEIPWTDKPALMALPQGARCIDGSDSAGDRVQIPWGSGQGATPVALASLSDDAKTIIKRSIEWAITGGGGAVPGAGTYADSFNSQAYNNSSGTLDWSTSPWVEVGEADGVSSGDIGVFNDAAYWRLRLRDSDNGGEGVEREADLSAAGSATLEFYYKRYRLDDLNDYVKVEISANGAAGPWTELLRLEGPANDAEYLSESQDISAYISANTRIRFITSPDMGDQDAVWFDDVTITILP